MGQWGPNEVPDGIGPQKKPWFSGQGGGGKVTWFFGGALRSGGKNFLQAQAFVVVIAGEDEFAVDAFGQNMALEQGRGELNRLAAVGPHNDVFGGAAIIVQKLLG